MAMIEKTKEVVVKQTCKVRVSDFSGLEIPQLHWAAVTNIMCFTSDHGHLGGNKTDVFELDLLPEEMNDFREKLCDLVAQMKAKYSKRKISG